MESSLQIKFEYKLLGQSVWKTLPMPDSVYFDPSYMSKDEPPEIEDVPLYDHAVEYLDVDPSLVENTRIILIDSLKDENRTINETFWNGGRNRIIERTDLRSGEVNYWELITDCHVVGRPSTVEIISMGKKEGVLVLYYHVFITDNADGSQTEFKVYP